MAVMNLADFRPRLNPFSALLNHIYQGKFSRNVPLVVVLLSAVYTVYRTNHYMTTEFGLGPIVALPTAIFLEALVLAASSSVFLACRASYLAELKETDMDRAGRGVWLSLVALVVSLAAMLVVAGADAYAVTNDYAATVLMVLAQFAQAAFIILFLIQADLDERERLRVEVAAYTDTKLKDIVSRCRHCRQQVSPNNRARHEASCPARTLQGV